MDKGNKQKDLSKRWIPYQWPWTDKNDNKMNLKDWFWSRKFSVSYVFVVTLIVLILDFASTRRCDETWALAFQCDKAIWMIKFKTDFWPFMLSCFTSPFFHNGIDHILFVIIFGFALPVQSFESQHGTKATMIIFFMTYILIALFTGFLFNFGLEHWPNEPFIAFGFERNWMGGSAGFYGMMGAIAFFSGKKWFLPLMIFLFECVNYFLLGIALQISFLHIWSAIFGFLMSWIWVMFSKSKRESLTNK